MLPKFDTYACIGDSIAWKSGPFDMRATIAHDSDTSPDDIDGLPQEHIEAWKRDEWFFCGVIVTASIDGVELGKASLWGIDCNFPGSDNSYLSEVASELEAEAVSEARGKIASINAKAA
jgi:hypothetical protein